MIPIETELYNLKSSRLMATDDNNIDKIDKVEKYNLGQKKGVNFFLVNA